MRIPIYKQISLTSEQPSIIYAQLNEAELGKVPVMLIIKHLQQPVQALESIENYILEHQISCLPYPIVVIAAKEIYSEVLDIYDSPHKVPQFFNQKSKNLNNKEQDLLKELELRQKNLNNLRARTDNSILKKYGISHRRIFELGRENFFYEQLLQKIKGE